LRLFPLVKVFTQTQLTENLIEAGFEIDREWLPKNNAAVFIIAKKPDSNLMRVSNGHSTDYHN
jgi:hypothetical protein